MTAPRPRKQRRRPAEVFEDSATMRAIRAVGAVARTGIPLLPFLAELEKRRVIGSRGDGTQFFFAPDAARVILEMAEATKQGAPNHVA